MGTRRREPELPWHSLSEALGAGGRIDRVELKTVVDVPIESVMSVLDPTEPTLQLRRVHYLDTPDAALHRRGVVVRVRVCDGVGEDAVVKLRRPAPPARRRLRGLTVELDALPHSVIWSTELKRPLRPGQIKSSMERRRGAARRLLSPAQRALLCSAAGDGFDLDDLVVFGPVAVVRLSAGRRENRVDVESWTYPDGSHIVELSAKCRPARSHRVAATMRDLIADRRIGLSGQQATKTQISMQRLTGGEPRR